MTAFVYAAAAALPSPAPPAAELLAHRARVLCTIAELRAVIHKEGTPTP